MDNSENEKKSEWELLPEYTQEQIFERLNQLDGEFFLEFTNERYFYFSRLDPSPMTIRYDKKMKEFLAMGKLSNGLAYTVEECNLLIIMCDLRELINMIVVSDWDMQLYGDRTKGVFYEG